MVTWVIPLAIDAAEGGRVWESVPRGGGSARVGPAGGTGYQNHEEVWGYLDALLPPGIATSGTTRD